MKYRVVPIQVVRQTNSETACAEEKKREEDVKNEKETAWFLAVVGLESCFGVSGTSCYFWSDS